MMVKMEQDADIRSLPLSLLPSSTRQVLSDLMNSTKVIPADGPNRLPRDWRGLAALANISSEVGASIYDYTDKTARVLELWTRNKSATIGNLLDSLQILDRYDVYEDIYEDLKEYSGKTDLMMANNKLTPTITVWDDSEIITYDDRPGYKHHYDAYVLYANEDQDFVDKLIIYLAKQGLEICTKDKLLPGHATQYAPVSKLISQRCRRIILVFSPEFLNSSADAFFRDYAQAISIESRENKIIPIMYRACTLPTHLALYHMLRYNTGMYSFWEKLAQTLNIGRMPRILNYYSHSLQLSHSSVNITEMPRSDDFFLNANENSFKAHRSASVEAVPITSSPEGSITSESSQGTKKKSGLFRTFYRKVRGKKSKKEFMVSC